LTLINANFIEFYGNMTTYEACFVILKKLIDHSNDIESINGFPEEFNFHLYQANKIQTYQNNKWYPFVQTTHNSSPDQILNEIIISLQLNPDTLYFHGTSWESALSIMDGIRILPRQYASDFGLRNFYLTDSFNAAYIWALKIVNLL